MSMKFIAVTHANNNSIVYIPVNQIFAYYYSEGHKATLLVATGGAMIPVKESVDEVKAKMLS
jgi:hypothetical protein